jgi:hypothetical protein
MSRGFAPLLALALGASWLGGCAAGPAATTVINHQTVIEATAPSGPASLALTADKLSYERGEAIGLSLENRGPITYGRDAEACRRPVAVWLRDHAGATYFLRSGARLECVLAREPIEPGDSVSLARVDSAMVWLDRTGSDDTVYRLPAPLPAGSYTVHASLPLGELVTRIEVR